jgi:hypothetical protein
VRCSCNQVALIAGRGYLQALQFRYRKRHRNFAKFGVAGLGRRVPALVEPVHDTTQDSSQLDVARCTGHGTFEIVDVKLVYEALGIPAVHLAHLLIKGDLVPVMLLGNLLRRERLPSSRRLASRLTRSHVRPCSLQLGLHVRDRAGQFAQGQDPIGSERAKQLALSEGLAQSCWNCYARRVASASL